MAFAAFFAFLYLITKAEAEFSISVAEEDKPLPESNGFSVEIIRAAEENPPAQGKSVLIYHTHTYEAYEATEESTYSAIERWRTKDEAHNVTAVGKALAASLTALGLNVTHDTTEFEPPSMDTAYDRSLAMLESRLADGEQYDLYIDLHRDAIAASSTIKRTVSIGGEDVARFMVLIGQGTSGGYAQQPQWEENRKIAQKITDELNGQCAGLARDVKIKTGRFNQHISTNCILIECGMNTNTLEQVLLGIPYLANAIANALNGAE